ncbi:MAG: hypothetical protein C0591_06780 [Marinilabiliales bacterium]|nr:MAG: hypothetical protein C0591_06780 [Marinilabiliales bacterium]
MQNTSFTDSRMFKLATLLVVFVVTITILIVGKSFLIPLAWGLLIALASIKFLDKLEKKLKINRLLSSLLFVGVVLLGILFLFYFFYSEIRSIVSGMPSFSSKLSGVIQNLLTTAEGYGIPVPENIDRNSIHGWVSGHSEQITAALASFGKNFGKIFLVAVYLFFFTFFRDNYIYYLRLRENTDAGYKMALKKYNDVMSIINNFISGYFIMTVVMAIMLFVIFLLVGLKYALFFAILVALLSLLPYIGYPVGAVIVFIFASIFNDTLLVPLLAVGGILLANTLKSYILKPIIIGDKINLNAFIIFLSVIVGGMIWGVTGMILFMPLVGVVKVLLEYNEKTKPLTALLSTVPKDVLHQIDEHEKIVSKK